MEFETWFQNHFDDEIIEKHVHESTDRAAIKVAMKKLAEDAYWAGTSGAPNLVGRP